MRFGKDTDLLLNENDGISVYCKLRTVYIS